MTSKYRKNTDPKKKLKYIDTKNKKPKDLIRDQTPIHSKVPNQNWYDNYDRIFRKEKTMKYKDRYVVHRFENEKWRYHSDHGDQLVAEINASVLSSSRNCDTKVSFNKEKIAQGNSEFWKKREKEKSNEMD